MISLKICFFLLFSRKSETRKARFTYLCKNLIYSVRTCGNGATRNLERTFESVTSALLELFSTFDTLDAYWRLNSVTFLTFHNQSDAAVLTIVIEECGLPTLRAVDCQRKPAAAASYPVSLNWRATFGASGFQRVQFSAHRTNVRIRGNQLAAVFARFLIA